jgi:hypothetical protein
MSSETLEHLNANVLIGNTEQRGHAWRYRAGALLGCHHESPWLDWHQPATVLIPMVEAQQFGHLGQRAEHDLRGPDVVTFGRGLACAWQARTPCAVSCGYSSSTPSTVTLSASRPTTMVTGIRVPRTHGTPPHVMDRV